MNNGILEHLEVEQGLDIKIGGMGRIAGDIASEMEYLRKLSNELSDRKKNIYYSFGDNNIVLCTNDFGDVGALTIYLARQAGCKVICCAEGSCISELHNSTDNFYSGYDYSVDIGDIISEAELFITVASILSKGHMFYLDEDSYNSNMGFINKFKMCASRPFGSDAIGILDSEDYDDDIGLEFKCQHIHLGIADENIVYAAGPLFRTYVIAYTLYQWLLDNYLSTIHKGVVYSRVGEAAMLEQLAEDASKLSEAAIKKARKIRHENPIFQTTDELGKGLIEKYSEVYSCAAELGLRPDRDVIRTLDTRFLERWYCDRINRSDD